MPYVYVGLPSPYGGKPLFRILNNLKNFGIGRIVYRTNDYERSESPSFYKILFAQPEMDPKNLHGRVIAERVLRGVRVMEPVNLSEEASIPDYRLVPKEEEPGFCKWESIRDYQKELDAIRKPKLVQVPPMLKLYMQRSRANKGEEHPDREMFLPAHKVYTGDFLVEDRTQTHILSTFLQGEFEDYKDFDMSEIPTQEWMDLRFKHPAAIRIHKRNIEGKGWEEKVERDNKIKEMEAKVKKLGL
eukprot:TRINITY_DN3931_c0_g1_i1.p1 TRINITY_DN3931_c0_g1~~TRINITY_DN3931_c0_g1_i1.p1  ORF type:complete len:244 (-),score=65.94 TRINITY_DN3931_c0_g1_i1:76-807(-)